MTAAAGDLPAWVMAAKRMPIAFAQVREDALIDLALLDRIVGENVRVIMVASGGCTAAALVASEKVARLHLVDVNPAQLALTRLKIHLLKTASPAERAKVLGHAAMHADRAAALLKHLDVLSLSPDALGPIDIVAPLGPDHAGRYELLFLELREEMDRFADEWRRVLMLPEEGARSAMIAPDTAMGRAMDAAFDRVMSLPNLVGLFGAAATQNSVEAFSRHFAARTRHAIARMSTSDNPYLWQMLTGGFPSTASAPWLNEPSPSRLPDVIEMCCAFDHALCNSKADFDFVHLSNILDWLSVAEAQRTLELAYRALRPGGYVLIRQLNSSLDLQSLGSSFQWLNNEADRWHAADRSFFYRRLHLGRKG